ncbi:anion transporter [Rhodoblastus acidophilus]|uniref:Anion transporter n=1 Tax=Candidatus Rhodoblastus alkanivorans TaxID=2954117 RepID=A0ABS9Z6Y5_9HYPH|nr:anion transporter [Candidatus Rhodoblastus alkanivorans]MCI4679184.1 anion transporter [Candidatus Rhodoblastus alkanivorans]MCI4683180.1 anion transporter [Candidatus Rhodoblastus alkanivorans]MDI4640492.1 anion transporter [Rhodoblastus acidophilus]
MPVHKILVATIFLATYGGVALGRLPFTRLDRAGIALVGAAAMIVCGAVTTEEAFKSIDLGALALLFGMMAIVAELELAGFFRAASLFAARRAHSQWALLAGTVAVTGVFSAFLVNDAVCLVMAPLILRATRALRLDPKPYLLGVALASNAGGAATITGNPQNMIIGASSHIGYGPFAAALTPVAGVALLLVFAFTAFVHRGVLRGRLLGEPDLGPARPHRALILRTALVALGVVVAFFLGVPAPEAALAGAGLLLMTPAVKPQKVYRRIDGGLLLMFAGLFIVAAAGEKTFLTPEILRRAQFWGLDNAWTMTAVAATLSNLISNVPAVLALKPFVAQLPRESWLVVAMATTLAGNLTLLGSAANLIVAEIARRAGEPVTFRDFLVVGFPATLLSLAFGAWFLAARLTAAP